MIDHFVGEKTRNELKDQTTKYLVAAFGLVAGLAWNDAIKALIELLFPFTKSGVLIKFIYAIIITIVVVLLGRYIFKSSHAE
jgi:C4-dicarboxylate transporter